MTFLYLSWYKRPLTMRKILIKKIDYIKNNFTLKKNRIFFPSANVVKEKKWIKIYYMLKKINQIFVLRSRRKNGA